MQLGYGPLAARTAAMDVVGRVHNSLQRPACVPRQALGKGFECALQPGQQGRLLAQGQLAGCFPLPPWRSGGWLWRSAQLRRRRRPLACCFCWAGTRRCCEDVCPKVGSNRICLTAPGPDIHLPPHSLH